MVLFQLIREKSKAFNNKKEEEEALTIVLFRL
jgi:hypothetical protein